MKVGDKVFVVGGYYDRYTGKTGIIRGVNARLVVFPIEVELDGFDHRINHFVFNEDELMVIPSNISELRLKFLKLLYCAKN